MCPPKFNILLSLSFPQVDKVCGESVAEAQSTHPTTAKMIPTVTLVPEPMANQSDSNVMKQPGRLSHLRRLDTPYKALSSLTLPILMHIHGFKKLNLSHDLI